MERDSEGELDPGPVQWHSKAEHGLIFLLMYFLMNELTRPLKHITSFYIGRVVTPAVDGAQ